MGDYMGSAFTPPMDRELSPRLNDGTFRAFIHDTHHAYLLLHRAFQSLPPTVIPNIVPASPLGPGELDQPDYLRPASLPDARDMVPSPSSLIEDDDKELFPTTAGQDLPPRKVKGPLPQPVRHCKAPAAWEVPIPNSTLSKSPFELLPNLLLTVDAAQLEVTSTKPQKPATSPARAHHRDQLSHEHGPPRIWPNFASSNKMAKLDRIGKQSQES